VLQSKIVKAATAFAVLLLAGCAGGDSSLSNLMVAPGQYDIYHCDDLARSIQGRAARVRELESLKARAETGAGGQLVSAAVYEPDLLRARGELKEMQRSAREKQCGVPAAPAATATLPSANQATAPQQDNNAVKR